MNKPYKYLALFIFMYSGHLLACDCDSMLRIKDAIKDADLVIHGKILSATLNKDFSKDGRVDDAKTINEYVVLVIKKYKAAIQTDTIIVRTNDDERTCGLTFEENSEVFFYAYKTGKGSDFYSASRLPLYWTSSCYRTDEFTPKEQDELEQATKVH
jgi:hypothetical protein